MRIAKESRGKSEVFLMAEKFAAGFAHKVGNEQRLPS
jgi:hypothetical protein